MRIAQDTIERRIISATGTAGGRISASDLRASEEAGQLKITGYTAVFNSESQDLGGFTEIILPGCFADTIRSDDVRALFNHDPDNILGRNVAGTLKMREDSRGLYVEIFPGDTQMGRDVHASVKRGDISGMSFGFRTITDNWRSGNGGIQLRELIKVKLFDVGPVTYPAYLATTAGARGVKPAWEIASDARERQIKLAMVGALSSTKPAWQTDAMRRRLRLAENGIYDPPRRPAA
jgi:HK97 family phage prohead protease